MSLDKKLDEVNNTRYRQETKLEEVFINQDP